MTGAGQGYRVGVSKGPDTGLPEAMAALFTCKSPVLRLFVLIYFKLGKAEEYGALVPSASMGREEGGALFLR